VVWEGGSEPAPQPVEPIRAVHHVPIEGLDRLIVPVADTGLYMTTSLPSRPGRRSCLPQRRPPMSEQQLTLDKVPSSQRYT
jgi:hypothetical protein